MEDNDMFPVLSVILNRHMQIRSVIVSQLPESPGTRLLIRVGGAPGGKRKNFFEN